MAKLLKLRRGTTTQHASFTGAEGEVTIDTTKDTAVVHDGAQAGGRPLLREDMSNLPAGTIDNADVNSSAAIAGTKISPNFGSQNIVTTGNINLSDSTGSTNNKIVLGTGSDLEIYHDGTSNIVFAKNGDLNIRTNNSENSMVARQNGAAELYYDNVKKFETTSSGVSLSGHINLPDNATGVGKIKLGDGNDLQLYHDGSNSNIVNNTGFLLLKSNSGINLSDASDTDNYLKCIKDGAVELYYDGAKKLETYQYGVNFAQNIQIGTHAYWEDNGEAIFGTGSDLKIYHDGSNSYISESGTGDLIITGGVIRPRTNQFTLNNAANTENMISAVADDAVKLYFDGSKKFETTSLGAQVTGRLNVSGNFEQDDNVKANWGNSHDLQVYHDASNSYIDNSTGSLFVRSDTIKLRGKTNGEDLIEAFENGSVRLYYNNVNQIETLSNGVRIKNGHLQLNEADNQKAIFGASDDIEIYHNGTHSYIDENGNGNLVLRTNPSGTYAGVVLQAGQENSVICHKNGNVELYFDNAKKFETTSGGVIVNGALTVSHGNYSYIHMGDDDHGSRDIHNNSNQIGFLQQSGNWGAYCDDNGNWTASGNVTAYSDSRLKRDISTINDALGIVGKLRGVSYKWLRDGSDGIGVIAQEVEEVIPSVVVTNKVEGLDGIEEIKSVDYGKIVGVLINAINELKAEVDELKGGK